MARAVAAGGVRKGKESVRNKEVKAGMNPFFCKVSNKVYGDESGLNEKE